MDLPQRALTGGERQEWRAGWRVVLGSALGLGTAANLHYYVSTLFVVDFTREFGWSRGELAAVQAIALWAVVVAPFVGRWVDRSGLRRVLIVGMVLLTAVYALTALMPRAAWAPLVAFALIQGVGQATGTIPHTRAIAAWFSRQRGLALGVAITGIPLASALVAPFLSGVIEDHGWRAGYVLLALLAGAVGLPAAILWVRDTAAAAASASPSESTDSPAAARRRPQLARAARSLPFWLLLGAMVLVNVPGGGFINQLAPMLADGGRSAGEAAGFVSLFAIAVVLGRLLSGALLDRFDPARVAAAFTLCPAVGLALIAGLTSPPLVLTGVAIALVGVQQGAELDLLAFFTARLFGMDGYGALYGIGYAASVVATSAGVFLFGASHDSSGSYGPVLWASVTTFCLASLCWLRLSSAGGATARADPPGG